MKRLISALIASMLATSAFGLSAAKTSKNSKVNAELAPFKVSSGTPKDIGELTKHLLQIDKNLLSLSAQFTQSLKMPDAGLSQKVEGKLEYLKPSRLRLEHKKPEEQTLVADGNKIWVYRVNQNQVIESSLSDWKKSGPLMNDLMDFGNYSKLISSYDVAYDSHTLEVTFRPKGKTEEPFVLKLKLSGPYLFPMETELEVARTTVRTSLSNVRFNPKLAESEFHFTPPQNAQVFDNFKLPMNGQPTQ